MPYVAYGQQGRTGMDTWLYAGPTLLGVSPATGSFLGATLVTITGKDFTPGMTFKLNGVGLSLIIVLSSTTATGVTLAAALGPVDIQATALDGKQSNVLVGAYTYV